MDFHPTAPAAVVNGPLPYPEPCFTNRQHYVNA